MRPARDPASSRAAPYATGIRAVPKRAASERVPTSPSPNGCFHSQAST